MSTIGWIIVAIIWIAIAFWPARVAGRKGHSFIGYFIFSLVFFPARAAHGVHGPGPNRAGSGLATQPCEQRLSFALGARFRFEMHPSYGPGARTCNTHGWRYRCRPIPSLRCRLAGSRTR